MIKLPRFDYMCQKNAFSGSIGDFRYKFFPNEEFNAFIAAVYKDNCYEVEKEAGRIIEEKFSYDEAGIIEAEKWIMEQYDV
ncbi:MAG: hypothetical protein GX241_06985 [Ruminococcaceae bacterium]|nr:hypothetical protein [Oscillospiraceae bacterium]